MADEDYEHWPDNDKLQAVAATPAPRYDGHNGLYEHIYRPPGTEVKDVVPAPAAHAPRVDTPMQQQQPLQYIPYTQMPYGQQVMQMPPYMAWPAPAYYGYGGQSIYPPAYTTDPAPVSAPAPKDDATKPAKIKKDKLAKEKSPSPPPLRKWQGRTKAEVEEDDMKIAAAEGAYAERKVQPMGLADDQVVWVVEVGGGNVLRTFAEVKDAKGEWKTDPRFKDSWYFVREAEKEQGKKEEKK